MKTRLDNDISCMISELFSEFDIKDIASVNSGGKIKMTFRLAEAYIEMNYDITDNFYTAKAEVFCAGELDTVIFFTRSRRFKHDVPKRIGISFSNRKNPIRHFEALAQIIHDAISSNKDLLCLKERYKEDLKFDGIFI